jgi:hypothetical protein
LLWWFDIFELQLGDYPEIWDKEVKPCFSHTLPVTCESWDNLTEYIQNNPIDTPDAAEKALLIICEKLIQERPVISVMPTSGGYFENFYNS